MNKIFCDKCGEEIEGEVIMLKIIRKGYVEYPKDLCEKCAKNDFYFILKPNKNENV